MTKETLQQKIEERAKRKANDEYRKFVDFMQTNELLQKIDSLSDYFGEQS